METFKAGVFLLGIFVGLVFIGTIIINLFRIKAGKPLIEKNKLGNILQTILTYMALGVLFGVFTGIFIVGICDKYFPNCVEPVNVFIACSIFFGVLLYMGRNR